MRMFIPEIGTRIFLVSDWTFKLKRESRNFGLWEAFELHNDPEVAALQDKIKEAYHKGSDWTIPVEERSKHWNWWLENRDPWREVTLPALTELSVDRIYIRKGVSGFSSLTFNLSKSPDKRFNLKSQGGNFPKGCSRRFFAPLSDVNRIDFEMVPSS